MRALVIQEGGRLVIEDRPTPEPGTDQVLVRVHGAGINRADLLQRAGRSLHVHRHELDHERRVAVAPAKKGLTDAGHVET